MYKVLIQGTDEEPIVYAGQTYSEVTATLSTVEDVFDALDQINIRKRTKGPFLAAVRKARIYLSADKDIFQEEAEDGSWAIIYWKE